MRSGWMHCDNGEGQERFAPKTTMEGVEGLLEAKAGYDAHLASKNNPHGVTAEQVGAATPTDVTAAVQTARAVNLLDNSDFTRPVNQRGSSSYNAPGAYCLDRWMFNRNQIGDGSVVLSDGCIQFVNTSADYAGLVQRIPIELVRGKEGVTFTAAYGDTDGNVYCASFPFGQTPGGKAMGGIKVYSTAPKDTYAPVYYRNENAGTTTSVKWVALYEGNYTADILPPYVPKGYTAEMLACKRYCRVIDWGTTRYTGFFGAATSGTTAVYAILPIDVPMRVTPSLSSTAGTNFRLYGGDVSFNPTSVSVWFAGNNAIGLVFACTAVAGRVYVVYPATGTPIVLSADL